MPRHTILNSSITISTSRWVSVSDTILSIEAFCTRCEKRIRTQQKFTNVDQREYYDSEILLHVKDGLEKLREDECLALISESTAPQ